MLREEVYFKRVLRVLEEMTEEEVVANGCKIVRMILKDDNVTFPLNPLALRQSNLALPPSR